MAIRQYIGARYVLKIYENSLNPQSADWEANTSYEPLTMVNYNNSSYISRKDVPANIGDPVSNPTYWALSGLYNGQIASLDMRITALEEDNELLTDKKIIMITDSYGNRTYNSKTIADLLRDYGHNIVFDIALSGGAFAQSNTALKFETHVTDYTGDADKITDVLFCGGVNDRIYTYASIVTNIRNTIALAKTTYPNARIHVIPWGVSFDGTLSDVENMYKIVPYAYKYGTTTGGGIVAENAEYMLRDTRLLDTDLVHPKADGVYYVASLLNAYLLGGTIDVDRFLEAVPTAEDATITDVSLKNIIMRRHNGNVSIMAKTGGWGFIRFKFPAATTFIDFNPLFKVDDSLIAYPLGLQQYYFDANALSRDSSNHFVGSTGKFLANGDSNGVVHFRCTISPSTYNDTYTSFDMTSDTIIIND